MCLSQKYNNILHRIENKRFYRLLPDFSFPIRKFIPIIRKFIPIPYLVLLFLLRNKLEIKDLHRIYLRKDKK